MPSFRVFVLSFAAACMLFLAACESDADKAERYYQSGLELIEEGDKDRALIELRNVFKYDGFHRKARETYAGIVLEMGRTTEAYSQYLLLIEQYPDEVDARITLAQLAIEAGNWQEAERHGRAAIELAPDRPETQALDLLLQYRAARLDKDREAQTRIATSAKALIEKIRAESPEDNRALVRLVLDNMVQKGTPDETLAFLDAALEREPKAEDLHMMKVQALEKKGDIESIGTQLTTMTKLFPENKEIKQAMINWFLIQDDLVGAEAYLRTEAGEDTGPTEGHISVIQFLRARMGEDAAQAEISRLEAANAGTDRAHFYAALRVSATYKAGKTAEAIAELQKLIDATGDAEQKVNMQVMLAQMLIGTGEVDQADTLIASVLKADPSNVAALKMQGSRLIAQDQPGEAIIALRRALNQNPRDAETLTIMAQAHQRDGDIELAAERLALAVEVSGNSAPLAMRYAQLLISQDRLEVAKTVLENARREDPRNPQLLAMLGSVNLQAGAWQDAQGVVNALRALGTPSTNQAATELRAAILQGQNRIEDSLNLLESRINEDENVTDAERIRSTSLIVQTQIRNGDIPAARSYLDTALAKDPDDPDLRMLDATLHVISGDMAAAEAGYRALIADFPKSDTPVRLLTNALNGYGQEDTANAVLKEALERMPENPTLLSLRAEQQERDGDIPGAIATYELLYAQNSANPVFANNLASLIGAHLEDEESLTRAAGIVRRLRGTEVPAFQDTYGWIAYRRGNLDEALEYLKPAAADLQNDALVQYHLGMVYAGLGNVPAARLQLERALTLDKDRDLPQMQNARQTLESLPEEDIPAAQN